MNMIQMTRVFCKSSTQDKAIHHAGYVMNHHKNQLTRVVFKILRQDKNIHPEGYVMHHHKIKLDQKMNICEGVQAQAKTPKVTHSISKSCYPKIMRQKIGF